MRSLFRFAAVLALVLSGVLARADTYQVFNVGNENVPVYGLDDDGHVEFVIDGCLLPGSHGTCYSNWYYGQTAGLTTIPILVPDNGVKCAGVGNTSAFVRIETEVCNGGRAVLSGYTSLDQHTGLLYLNGDPNQPLFGSGSTIVYLNSKGDILFDDIYSEYYYVAYDLTSRAAPEPSSIALLGTGLLGVGCVLGRQRCV